MNLNRRTFIKTTAKAGAALTLGIKNSNEMSSVVSIIGCTGDWFGGWDGLVPGNTDKFITEDLQSGRMVDVIDRDEPAIMVCHWPGIYYNGDKVGFNILKNVVRRLNQKYDNLVWMKLSEISKFWAAKELTSIIAEENKILLKAPFTSRNFTLKMNGNYRNISYIRGSQLKQVENPENLKSGTFFAENHETVVGFDLQKGESQLQLS